MGDGEREMEKERWRKADVKGRWRKGDAEWEKEDRKWRIGNGG